MEQMLGMLPADPNHAWGVQTPAPMQTPAPLLAPQLLAPQLPQAPQLLAPQLPQAPGAWQAPALLPPRSLLPTPDDPIPNPAKGRMKGRGVIPGTQYIVEVDPSGRATCNACKELISFAAVRLRLEVPQYGNRPQFSFKRHMHCVTAVQAGNALEAHGSVEALPGMDKLAAPQRELVLQTFRELVEECAEKEAAWADKKAAEAAKKEANKRKREERAAAKAAKGAAQQQQGAYGHGGSPGPATPAKRTPKKRKAASDDEGGDGGDGVLPAAAAEEEEPRRRRPGSGGGATAAAGAAARPPARRTTRGKRSKWEVSDEDDSEAAAEEEGGGGGGSDGEYVPPSRRRAARRRA